MHASNFEDTTLEVGHKYWDVVCFVERCMHTEPMNYVSLMLRPNDAQGIQEANEYCFTIPFIIIFN